MSSRVELRFGAFLTYDPRPKTEEARKARNVVMALKQGHPTLLDQILDYLAERVTETPLAEILGPDVTLVPAPGSAPAAPDWLSPPRMIAEGLQRRGLGRDVQELVRRTKRVQKSAFAAAGERPTVAVHSASIAAEADLAHSHRRLVLVDDVITRGATVMACARCLDDAFAGVEVSAFAMIRTMGYRAPFAQIEDPCVGTILAFGDSLDRVP